MLVCRETTGLVTDYVEGRLSTRDRLRFQWHLGLCRGCRRYLRQMRLTARSLGSLPAPVLPEHVREELERRFAGWFSDAGPQG